MQKAVTDVSRTISREDCIAARFGTWIPAQMLTRSSEQHWQFTNRIPSQPLTLYVGAARTCQDFFDRQTALRKGSSAGTPSADATTENARAVVLRTYSSMLSMSGRMAAIIVANPAALDRLAMISRPACDMRQQSAHYLARSAKTAQEFTKRRSMGTWFLVSAQTCVAE